MQACTGRRFIVELIALTMNQSHGGKITPITGGLLASISSLRLHLTQWIRGSITPGEHMRFIGVKGMC